MESPEDFWSETAHAFRTDPHRADDPGLNRILQLVEPGSTVLDVGGGGGRFSLPLALRCRHVTVVEPSPSMVEVLEQTARDYDIHNITVVNDIWEYAEVELVDVVLSTHVIYGVEDVVTFIKKMSEYARRRVIILLYMSSPQSHLAPVWRLVHQKERSNLPAMPELMGVLWEMGIYPNLEMVAVSGPRAYPDIATAKDELRRRLYVAPGSVEDSRLGDAVQEVLEEMPEGLVVRGFGKRPLALAWWPTDGPL